jgi:hypothetical protein
MFCRTRAFRWKSVVVRNKQQATNTLLPSSLGRLTAFLLIFISHFASENVSKAAAEPVQLLSNSLQLSNRCYGTRGLHCVNYHLQPYIKVVVPRTHSKTCPNGCSGKGVCNADTGQCDCPAGEVLHPASDWLDTADMHHQNTIYAKNELSSAACQHHLSAAFCAPTGVGGPDCGAADPRPCTDTYRKDRHSKLPASHIGANMRDLNWTASGWTSSR